MATRADFLQFIRGTMGVPVERLPDNSAAIDSALALAGEIVSDQLQSVSQLIFDQATYNLAAHILIEIAQDATQQVATFTGAVSGMSLTATVVNGVLAVGQLVSGAGMTDNKIISLGNGTGGAGTYNLASPFFILSEPMTSSDILPFADGLPYFAYYRKAWSINAFVAGVVASTSDESTSVSYDSPDFIKQLSLADLQYLKSPFGRQYMAYAQRLGYPMGRS